MIKGKKLHTTGPRRPQRIVQASANECESTNEGFDESKLQPLQLASIVSSLRKTRTIFSSQKENVSVINTQKEKVSIIK